MSSLFILSCQYNKHPSLSYKKKFCSTRPWCQPRLILTWPWPSFVYILINAKTSILYWNKIWPLRLISSKTSVSKYLRISHNNSYSKNLKLFCDQPFYLNFWLLRLRTLIALYTIQSLLKQNLTPKAHSFKNQCDQVFTNMPQ